MGTAFAVRPDDLWFFGTRDGCQDGNDPFFANRAWAVHSGNVVAVPEPETDALMLAGIGAVAIAARRRFQGG
ncbi:MAG: PEP-CTERM sorting domain-containing protein [Burkholderiales bacterium]|nr:PEP-CTERM sorting domain-containing protein [Burkholderiales bacterium]